MLYSTLKIPYGLAINIVGFEEVPVTENYAHRPDLIPQKVGREPSPLREFLLNELNNISPIVLTQEKTYKFISERTRSYIEA